MAHVIFIKKVPLIHNNFIKLNFILEPVMQNWITIFYKYARKNIAAWKQPYGDVVVSSWLLILTRPYCPWAGNYK